MIKWSLVLHFYQPPTQSLAVTEAALRQCYLPLADLLLAYPEAKFSLNISGSLLENFTLIPDQAFNEKVKILIGRRQVELLSSPLYHPLLPLVTPEERERHVNLNREIINKTFQTEPIDWFYPPELAVNPEIVKNQTKIIVDESSFFNDWSLDKLPKKSLYQGVAINSRAVCEIIRSFPGVLTAEKFLPWFKGVSGQGLVVSVSDAEIFGHHYTERINFLKELFQGSEIEFSKLSDVAQKNDTDSIKADQITASTWQTEHKDLQNDNPYPLWLSKDNDLQQKYHQLAVKAYGLIGQAPESYHKDEAWTRYHRGISSCHYYWLSNWPWWHPDLVENGARELMKSIRALDLSRELKTEAEKFYHEFLMEMWDYHWSGRVEERYREYNIEREKLLAKLPIK